MKTLCIEGLCAGVPVSTGDEFWIGGHVGDGVGAALASQLERVKARIGEAVQGKDPVIHLALVAALAQGHLLIEDVPGVGKTTLALALAAAFGCSFNRIQFTNDLLPSDVLGLYTLGKGGGEFEFKPGPIFAQVVLADEVNRTSPKTQSGLLEAMSDGHVTLDGRTHPLPKPFMVIATQNPMEHHGTYPLPESQLDRFLMRLSMGYPDREAERRILRGIPRPHPGREVPIIQPEELLLLQSEVDGVRVTTPVEDYLLALIEATRHHPEVALGVSPRGARALYRATQAQALLAGRSFAIPDDLKALAVPVLAHRLKLAGAGALGASAQESEAVMAHILTETSVPA